jgi:hypothetical protein
VGALTPKTSLLPIPLYVSFFYQGPYVSYKIIALLREKNFSQSRKDYKKSSISSLCVGFWVKQNRSFKGYIEKIFPIPSGTLGYS